METTKIKTLHSSYVVKPSGNRIVSELLSKKYKAPNRTLSQVVSRLDTPSLKRNVGNLPPPITMGGVKIRKWV